MNVVHVPRRFVREDWGGTETVVLETSKNLVKQGHEVRILSTRALSNRDHELVDGIEVQRFPYFYPYLGLNDGARAALDKKGGNLFSFQLLRHLQSAPSLDLIHAHTLNRLGGICRTVARSRKVPYVVSIHGGMLDVPVEESRTWTEATRGSFEWGRVLGWLVGSRHVIRDAAAILCVGAAEAEKMRARHPGKRVEYLPNGVDVSRFRQGDGARFRARHGIPDGDPVLLCVGRIARQKNQAALIDAWPGLAKRVPGLRLVMIGHVTDPSYRDQLLEKVRQYGAGDRITLIEGIEPGSSELVDAYHASDLFVLPSIHEPFGIVILEAWAARRPVLASRVGGIPGFVEDGVDGVLFDAGDSRELEEKIFQLLGSPDRRAQLGEAGYRKAEERFDWSAITSRLLRLYEEVRVESSVRQ